MPFAYQIRSCEDGQLLLYPTEAFDEREEDAIRKAVEEFFDQWNEANETKIHYLGSLKRTKRHIRIPIDFGGCSRDAVKELIYRFRNMNNIKKIVFRDLQSVTPGRRKGAKRGGPYFRI